MSFSDPLTDFVLSDSGPAYQLAIGSRFFLGQKKKTAIRFEVSRISADTFDVKTTYTNYQIGMIWRLGKSKAAREAQPSIQRPDRHPVAKEWKARRIPMTTEQLETCSGSIVLFDDAHPYDRERYKLVAMTIQDPMDEETGRRKLRKLCCKRGAEAALPSRDWKIPPCQRKSQPSALRR